MNELADKFREGFETPITPFRTEAAITATVSRRTTAEDRAFWSGYLCALTLTYGEIPA